MIGNHDEIQEITKALERIKSKNVALYNIIKELIYVMAWQAGAESQRINKTLKQHI